MEKDFGVKKIIVSLPEWEELNRKVRRLEEDVKTLSSGLPVVLIETFHRSYSGVSRKISYSGTDDAMQKLVKEHNTMTDARSKQIKENAALTQKIEALNKRGWFRRLFNMQPKKV